jgi:uncharacterized membrane protein YjjP (DUF1212 family)
MPELLVAVYVGVAGGWFAHGLLTEPFDWYYVAFAAVWALLALCLLSRRTGAAFLLLLFEWLALISYLGVSQTWDQFALQLVVTALIADPLVGDYTRAPPGPPPRRYAVVTLALMAGLVCWSAVVAANGDPDALKPLAMAGLLAFDLFRSYGNKRPRPPLLEVGASVDPLPDDPAFPRP